MKTLFSGCPDGFCGSNCSTPCIYPYYGEQSKYQCNCTEELCDHITGCTGHHGTECFSHILHNAVSDYLKCICGFGRCCVNDLIQIKGNKRIHKNILDQISSGGRKEELNYFLDFFPFFF